MRTQTLLWQRLVLTATTVMLALASLPAKASLGYALAFNGVNNYVAINRPVSNDFTISFWFASTQVAGDDAQWYDGMGMVDGFVSPKNDDFGITLGAGKVVFGTGTSLRSSGGGDGHLWRGL